MSTKTRNRKDAVAMQDNLQTLSRPIFAKIKKAVAKAIELGKKAAGAWADVADHLVAVLSDPAGFAGMTGYSKEEDRAAEHGLAKDKYRTLVRLGVIRQIADGLDLDGPTDMQTARAMWSGLKDRDGRNAQPMAVLADPSSCLDLQQRLRLWTDALENVEATASNPELAAWSTVATTIAAETPSASKPNARVAKAGKGGKKGPGKGKKETPDAAADRLHGELLKVWGDVTPAKREAIIEALMNA